MPSKLMKFVVPKYPSQRAELKVSKYYKWKYLGFSGYWDNQNESSGLSIC